MSNKNFKFIFSIYFIIFGVFITLFGSYVSYSMNLIDINSDIDKAAQEIGFIKKIDNLKPDVDKFDEIVKALSRNGSLDDYLKNPTTEKKESATNVFHAITMSNGLIMQARFIDAKGQEIIRIDRKNIQDIPVAVEESDLQDKSKRDYFQTVSRMSKEELWHSRIDLNIENGKVEVPYRPTLRVAQPIFRNNQFRGMVIVNLLASDMIGGLRKSTRFEHFIIDKDGYFISHPNDQYSWSRYTNSNFKLYEEFPLEAEKILSGALKGETFYSIQLNDVLNNDDRAILVLKPKEVYKSALISSNVKTSIFIIVLSIIMSIPLAILASIAPSRLQRSLVSANSELKRFSDIIDHYVITATTKTNSIITSVSTAFVKISGYSKDELIGQKINIIRHPDTPNEVYLDLWHTIESGKNWEGEIQNLDKNGNTYTLNQNIIPVKDQNGAIISYMTVSEDITSKKELEHLATIDKLTGIYNRRKLDEYTISELERAKRYKEPFSLMIIDIDHFKRINDTFGHLVGDETLIALTTILTKNIRNSDILGRFGGEEFVILCPQTNTEAIFLLAEKLRICVEEYQFSKIEHITISIGIAQYNHENTKEELFEKADKALYEAKNSGRNRTVVG